ncbi:MAG: septum formation initiator family protein [Bacteroidaceae bacterium]|nr:septum formation initiator family protein [Bacteroidaceae bacterium]
MNHPISHYLLKYKYFIAFAVFAVLIGLVGDHCLVRRMAQKREISDLQSQIQSQEERYVRDKQQLDRLNSDPEAVKRVAHERYYMRSTDEDVFVMED